MFNRIAATIHGLYSSRQGSVAVQVGVGLVALLGVAGLGTEGTFLLYKQRQMQTVADSAALSGAIADALSQDSAAEARAVAAGMGYVNGVGNTAVTVRTPVSGPYAGSDDAVEVIVSQPQNVVLLRLFGDHNVTVHARSVASVSSSGGGGCVLALDPTADRALYLSNNATLTDLECAAIANSSSESAIYLNNNAAISGPIKTHGNWQLQNNAHLCTNNCTNTAHAPVVDDPYADVTAPAAPACTGQSGSGMNNITRNLTPGHFCSGWDFKNNVTLNLAAGTYYIDSKLSITNNTVVNGTGGVTLVINGNYAIDIGNNARLNLTAPTSGDLAGLSFFGGRTATSTVTQKFSNNAVLNIQGAIYFPNQILEIDNNGSTNPNGGCTHVIGRKIVLMNNARLSNNCEDTGVRTIGGSSSAQLVE